MIAPEGVTSRGPHAAARACRIGRPGLRRPPVRAAAPDTRAGGTAALSVDVVIVTYRSAGQVSACIASASDSPLVGQIVVVDNASGDGSADVARQAGAHLVLQNSMNVGFARAVNQALKCSAAPTVLLLNPDARVEPADLERLVSLLTGDPAVAVAAPLLRSDRGDLTTGAGRCASVGRRVGLCVPMLGRAPAFRPEYRLSPAGTQRPFVADAGYVFGAAMVVDRAFLDATGGLDERFFLFAEDEDLCRRAHATGRRVLLDGRSTARHTGGASSGDAAAVEAQRLFSTWKLFGKWDGPAGAAAYRRGITAAFHLRAAAAVADGEARRSITRTRRLFAAAVRTGREPLLMDA